jgi:archaellum component FlaC
MKKYRSTPQLLNLFLGALTAALVVGCASRGYKQADKTGEAINRLRSDVKNVKVAVDASMKALDQLAATASTDPRPAYEAYAKSVDKVESAADTAKKDAEEMRIRGEEYFQNWENQLSTVKSEEIRALARERKAKLQETFSGIKDAAQAAKESFPPFLDDLKDLRTALSTDLTVQGIDAAKGIFKKTKSAGAEVEKNLDALITELNSVVAAVTAAKVPSGSSTSPAPASK